MGETLIWPGGGSGSGGTLIVTAPAGTVVIAQNDALGKIKSKKVNDAGIAKLTGLATGTWMLHCTNGLISSTPVPVAITADYTQTLAFFSATINVTYPAGSTCTCTLGEVQLVSTAAEDASGKCVFTVPSAGTWEVKSTANDGSDRSDSENVSVTTNGQTESVTLNYEKILFYMTDECSDVSGGWQALPLAMKSEGNYTPTAPTVTKYTSSTGIALAANSTGYWESGVYVTKDKIDLTDYKTLEFRGYASVPDSNIFARVVVLTNLSTPWAEQGHRATIADGSTHVEIPLDISSLNGAYYVGVALNASTNNSSRIVMSKMRIY